MSIRAIGDLIVVFGVVMIVSGFFHFRQVAQMNNILHDIGRKAPRVFRSTNGRFMKLRVYCFAASEQNGKVIDAYYLYTSFIFKPSKMVQATELIGKRIPNLNPEEFADQKYLENTIFNLKEDYRKRKNTRFR